MPAHSFRPRLIEAGEAAFLARFSCALDEGANLRALAFDRAAAALDGVVETQPTLASVLVLFDPIETDAEALRARLEAILEIEPEPAGSGRRWRLPALYGGEAGPDLAETAAALGLGEEETIAEHAGAAQRIAMIGFAPGFAYCAGLDERWSLPRLERAKPSVPAGSISVAVRQSVVSSTPAPTGWRTIARTPFRAFDPSREPACLFAPGDRIGFAAISSQEFAELSASGLDPARCLEDEP